MDCNYEALFESRRPLKALYDRSQHSPIHARTHTLMEEQPGAILCSVSVAKGHLDMFTPGAGDRSTTLRLVGDH